MIHHGSRSFVATMPLTEYGVGYFAELAKDDDENEDINDEDSGAVEPAEPDAHADDPDEDAEPEKEPD